MLSLYRRHVPGCKKKGISPERAKCSCPIWCDGQIDGARCRQSLKTSDWQRAVRLAERLERPNAERSDLIACAQAGCNVRVESGRCETHRKGIAEAIEAYHAAKPDLAHSTKHAYKRTLRLFELHLGKLKVQAVDETTSAAIDSFRATRSVSALTWTKELQHVRHFFRFAMKRKWTSENPAIDVQMPKNLKPTDKEPYSRNDVVKILAACDSMGRYPYERLRARAMVLLLRYTALRISDVATLAKDRVRNGEVYLRTMKNGKVVKLPAPAELVKALDIVPVPRGASGACRYFFWSGNGTTRAAVRDATRTLAAVFKASGVEGAHAHRFRHTLATELLEAGGSLEDVAEILGNSPNIIRKHYAKWSRLRQERITTLMRSVFGTNLVHEETASARR
jgi:site-specific recombinase XerD